MFGLWQRLLGGAAVLLLIGIALQSCSSPRAAVSPGAGDVQAIVTIKELMENIVDPTADHIFDAVAVDITDTGVVEHKPTRTKTGSR